MKFETILALITEPRLRRILEDSSRTPYQRAADIAAIFERESDDAAQPAPRKARTIKPKPEIENRDARPTQGDGETG